MPSASAARSNVNASRAAGRKARWGSGKALVTTAAGLDRRVPQPRARVRRPLFGERRPDAPSAPPAPPRGERVRVLVDRKATRYFSAATTFSIASFASPNSIFVTGL